GLSVGFLRPAEEPDYSRPPVDRRRSRRKRGRIAPVLTTSAALDLTADGAEGEDGTDKDRGDPLQISVQAGQNVSRFPLRGNRRSTGAAGVRAERGGHPPGPGIARGPAGSRHGRLLRDRAGLLPGPDWIRAVRESAGRRRGALRRPVVRSGLPATSLPGSAGRHASRPLVRGGPRWIPRPGRDR